MTGMDDCITPARWEDVWTMWLVLVDDTYQSLERHSGCWRRTGPAPVVHDSEVITVALIIDTWFHGHEALSLAFLRQYHPTVFPHLPSDSWFHQHPTRLGPLIDQIRPGTTRQYGGVSNADPDRLADSAPIPVATDQRAHANRTVTGAASFGVMNRRCAKRCIEPAEMLFGFRLHLTTTTHEVVDAWVLMPAAIHDSQVLPALVEDAACQTLLGDGAYHNPTAVPALVAR